MKSDLQTLEIQDWVINFRESIGKGPFPVIWLLHGWEGDDDSMLIFTSKLPEDYLLLIPRGRFPTTTGGYSWYPIRDTGWPTLEKFSPVIYELVDLMDNWPISAPWGDFSAFRIAGYSQGAALAYGFMMLFPERISAVAGLAGFLPTISANYPPGISLEGKTVYVSHGLEDDIVPMHKAREAVEFLIQAGADVTFCESEVGHKLSADCFKGLEVFFDH
jgi:phospholipase/carboxylesterase